MITPYSWSFVIEKLPLENRKWVMAQVESIVGYLANEIAKDPTEVNAIQTIKEVLVGLESTMYQRFSNWSGPWGGWWYVRTTLLHRGPHLLRYQLSKRGIRELKTSTVGEWTEHAKAW